MYSANIWNLLTIYCYLSLQFHKANSLCLSLCVSLSVSLSLCVSLSLSLSLSNSRILCLQSWTTIQFYDLYNSEHFTLQALGKNGRIIKIDQDGDVRVKVEDRAWIFSPVCINPVDNPEEAKEIPAIPAAECVDSDTIETVETQSNGR